MSKIVTSNHYTKSKVQSVLNAELKLNESMDIARISSEHACVIEEKDNVIDCIL